jgi:hypothetical protein
MAFQMGIESNLLSADKRKNSFYFLLTGKKGETLEFSFVDFGTESLITDKNYYLLHGA